MDGVAVLSISHSEYESGLATLAYNSVPVSILGVESSLSGLRYE